MYRQLSSFQDNAVLKPDVSLIHNEILHRWVCEQLQSETRWCDAESVGRIETVQETLRVLLSSPLPWRRSEIWLQKPKSMGGESLTMNRRTMPQDQTSAICIEENSVEPVTAQRLSSYKGGWSDLLLKFSANRTDKLTLSCNKVHPPDLNASGAV